MPNEGAQKLQDLLEGDRLQDKLREARRLGRWEFQNDEEEQKKKESWEGTPEWTRVQPLLRMHGIVSDGGSRPPSWVPPEAREAFEKHVIQNLPRPPIITVDDLEDAFREHLLVEQDEFKQAHPQFVQSVIDRLQDREGDALPVADYEPFDCLAEEIEEDFWDTWKKEPFNIEFFSEREPDAPPWTTLRARFRGTCTEKALKCFQKEAYDVIRSALKSYRLGYSTPDLEDDAEEAVCETQGAVWMVAGGLGDEEIIRHALVLVHRALVSYFTSPSEVPKNHIAFRIRNGLGYLVEADRHKPSALHMLLSVAALEALIGRAADEGITDKLADRCAVLLEPDKQKRKNCDPFVRGLYKSRSDVIHGRDFKSPAPYAVAARRLAAGVLLEVQEWADFMKRMGKKPCETELFKELKEASHEARLVDGLLGSTHCRDLWS